jgi:phage protein D
MVAVMGYLDTQQLYDAPAYQLTVDGRNITPQIEARLMSLTLTESRGDEADQLDIELDDADGALQLPPKGAEISLLLGWKGFGLVDKGLFEVDEIEHSGAPDRISIRARSAEMRRQLRTRSERSWHDTTVGAIVEAIARRNNLTPRVDASLAAIKVAHIDQTNESDLHFLTRLARQHDAVCTVKKGRLVFLPVNGTRSSTGEELAAIALTRAAGDQHRYHTADRHSYTGVRAYWHDKNQAEKRSVLVGTEENEKRLKDTHGSEADALAAARAEQGRVERGKATMALTLALGRPDLMPQAPVTLAGFKREIDATPWLVVKLTHSLGDAGLTTQIELETRAA